MPDHQPVPRGVARITDGSTRKMNKTEKWYATNVLAPLIASGTFHSWAFEAFKIRLADNTWYTIDFMVIRADGLIEFHEVKGSWKAAHQDDSRVKLKVAAENHQWAMFVAYEHKSRSWEWFVHKEAPDWIPRAEGQRKELKPRRHGDEEV